MKHWRQCNNLLSLIVLASVAVFLFGCGSEDDLTQMSAEERFAIGKAQFDDKEYLKAIESFRLIVLQYPGSEVADDAQFLMAEARFIREEYLLAAFEYDVLMRSMSTSPFVPQARFRKALCYYRLSPSSHLDQEHTRLAVDEFQAFIEYSPTDTLVPQAESMIKELIERLAEKEFKTGLLYMTMEYYRAATISFEHVMEKYHDTKFAESALLKKAEAAYYRKKYDDARALLAEFRVKYPASAFAKDADDLEMKFRDVKRD